MLQAGNGRVTVAGCFDGSGILITSSIMLSACMIATALMTVHWKKDYNKFRHIPLTAEYFVVVGYI